MTFKDKLKGCLICGAIGDAVGGPYEGSYSNSRVSFDFNWSVSDDTQLTLATCEAIYDTSEVEPEVVASRFRHWYDHNKLTGLGMSTITALKRLQDGIPWSDAGNKGEMAAGNGAAMRIAPLAFKNNITSGEIKNVSFITHQNEEAFAGALAMYHAVKFAFDKTWKGDDQLMKLLTSRIPESKVKDRLIELNNNKHLAIEEIGAMYKPTGYVVDSVPIAIFAAQKMKELHYQAILTELIKIGGDTDTTCFMAGQILGTLKGPEIIPKHWSEKFKGLAVRNLIEKVVENWKIE
jgi:ADP-ribosylglycohydrolase